MSSQGHEAQKHGILVHTTFFDGPKPQTLGDQAQLEQVFLNLVMNAIEAMSSSKSDHRVLELKTSVNEGHEVLVTVADNGPGVDVENLEKIFDAFFTTKPDGMGMGLSICRSIIESHAGTAMGVARESRVDLLCLIAKGQSMNRGDQQPVVIVIDDDQLVREAVSDLLRSVGLQTKMFASVSDFLKWKRPDAPSCLVLDVRLPGLSGLDFQSELNKEHAQIPIVFMTGHGDIPMSVRAMKGGAVDFLAKPFRDQDMIDAVQAGLEQDRARRKTVNVTVQLKSAFDSLTDREQEIMKLVTAGLMNKQIAGELGVSVVTVKFHRGNVMRKMGAKSVAELVRMADALGVRRTEPKNLYPSTVFQTNWCARIYTAIIVSARLHPLLSTWSGHRLVDIPVISIVDDDELVRDAVKSLVRSLGYAAAEHASAEDYLRSNERGTSSCLITDIQMPGMSGADLQAQLIAEGDVTPVIFMTAFDDKKICARVLEAGAFGYLKKPFDENALVQCLEKALTRGYRVNSPYSTKG